MTVNMQVYIFIIKWTVEGKAFQNFDFIKQI